MTQPNISLALRIAIALLAAALFAGCAHTEVVDNWKSEQRVTNKPDKVAVIAALPESLLREAVEVDVARILEDKGTPAVPSSRIAGMSGGIRGEIDPDAAAELLRGAGVDGVVVMFYVGGGRSEEYVRSDYWAEFIGSGVGYNWAQPYFVDVYTVNRGADILDYNQIIYVESSYYDLETEAPVWRIVTQTKDIEHADAAEDIAKKIASKMRSAGLK
jgi:hypothetical protein